MLRFWWGELNNWYLFDDVYIKWFQGNEMPSVESQKGINAVQQCSVENQKVAIAVQSLDGDSALLVLNDTLFNKQH